MFRLETSASSLAIGAEQDSGTEKVSLFNNTEGGRKCIHTLKDVIYALLFEKDLNYSHFNTFFSPLYIK